MWVCEWERNRYDLIVKVKLQSERMQHLSRCSHEGNETHDHVPRCTWHVASCIKKVGSNIDGSTFDIYIYRTLYFLPPGLILFTRRLGQLESRTCSAWISWSCLDATSLYPRGSVEVREGGRLRGTTRLTVISAGQTDFLKRDCSAAHVDADIKRTSFFQHI